MYWPKFESELLSTTVSSLKKRSKALKHKTKSMTCDRVIEKGNDGQVEKLELDICAFGTTRDISFRMFIWADRWAWVDIREPAKKGWLWEWENEGRLVGNLDGRRIIGALEDCLEITFIMNDKNTKEFVEIWKPLLAKGPKPIN